VLSILLTLTLSEDLLRTLNVCYCLGVRLSPITNGQFGLESSDKVRGILLLEMNFIQSTNNNDFGHVGGPGIDDLLRYCGKLSPCHLILGD
jgi:hypothetical protein